MQEAVNPASIKKIDEQTIFIGFGGGREGAQSTPVGVELESNCSRIAVNKAKKDRRRPCVLSRSKVLSVLCEA
jgi:hypothetical protein